MQTNRIHGGGNINLARNAFALDVNEWSGIDIVGIHANSTTFRQLASLRRVQSFEGSQMIGIIHSTATAAVIVGRVVAYSFRRCIVFRMEPVRNARVQCQCREFARLFFPGTFLIAFVAQFFQFLHLGVQRTGGLFLVVNDQTVSQIEKMAGVALHDAPHLVRTEGGNGTAAFALSTVLPPSSQCRKSQLNGVVIGVGTQPRTQNGLHVWVSQSRAGEWFVGEQTPFATIGIGFRRGRCRLSFVVGNRMTEGIKFRRWFGFQIFRVQTTQMRPSTKGTFKNRCTMFEFTTTSRHGIVLL
mmetsp:Transcript_32974/g.49807  ORF Transcript_32974/g.49807 Transcript_32974/m.49807 type:complete len:299 (-) Transcript_32974:584-1480(-)